MLRSGAPIGKYVVKTVLAWGELADFWLARAPGPAGFSKDVVIKLLPSILGRDVVERFQAEALLACRMSHPNIIHAIDFGQHEDSYFLVLEYVRGTTLRGLTGHLNYHHLACPSILAASILAQVASAVHYTHGLEQDGRSLNVVHCDLTPSSILLSFDGAVKLTDFGVAQAIHSGTTPGSSKDACAYMSPEQARGEPADARSDVFVLGVILWETLTGQRLFNADSDVAILRQVQGAIIPHPGRCSALVPPDVSDVVMKALARPKEERFQSAGDLAAALAAHVFHWARSPEEVSVGRFLLDVLGDVGAERLGASSRVARTTQPDGARAKRKVLLAEFSSSAPSEGLAVPDAAGPSPFPAPGDVRGRRDRSPPGRAADSGHDIDFEICEASVILAPRRSSHLSRWLGSLSFGALVGGGLVFLYSAIKGRQPEGTTGLPGRLPECVFDAKFANHARQEGVALLRVVNRSLPAVEIAREQIKDGLAAADCNLVLIGLEGLKQAADARQLKRTKGME